MDRQAFGRAREEAGKAAQKIAEIREAKTLQEVADLWSSFLTDIQRSYVEAVLVRVGAIMFSIYETPTNC
jgi:predicted translin family RNA/ssDNA-binding protein